MKAKRGRKKKEEEKNLALDKRRIQKKLGNGERQIRLNQDLLNAK